MESRTTGRLRGRSPARGRAVLPSCEWAASASSRRPPRPSNRRAPLLNESACDSTPQLKETLRLFWPPRPLTCAWHPARGTPARGPLPLAHTEMRPRQSRGSCTTSPSPTNSALSPRRHRRNPSLRTRQMRSACLRRWPHHTGGWHRAWQAASSSDLCMAPCARGTCSRPAGTFISTAALGTSGPGYSYQTYAHLSVRAAPTAVAFPSRSDLSAPMPRGFS